MMAEKRKRWLTSRGIKNCFSVSLGVLFIAIIYKIAEVLLDTSLPFLELLISGFIFIVFTALTLLASGLVNPDLTNTVFEMLGFKEESEETEVNPQNEENEGADERNDFLQLVEEHPNTISQEDLRCLLEIRLGTPSTLLGSRMTASISYIIVLISAMIAFVAFLFTRPLTNLSFYFMGAVGIIGVSGIIAIAVIFQLHSKNVNNLECKAMRQYLQAVERLNDLRGNQ